MFIRVLLDPKGRIRMATEFVNVYETGVGGGFGGQFAQGGEREVDRGGRQPSFDEVRAVAPQDSPGKAFSGGV